MQNSMCAYTCLRHLGASSACIKPLTFHCPRSKLTSTLHDATCRDHFTQHHFFGLDPQQVKFFQQGFLPCLTAAGQVIMETPSKVQQMPHSLCPHVNCASAAFVRQRCRVLSDGVNNPSLHAQNVCCRHPLFASTLPPHLFPPTCLLSSAHQVAKAPDGNGGLYAALEDSGTLADMVSRGLEALDVFCVDNALARVADPEFIGCCYSRGSQLGARMLAKAYPEEKVGVFAEDEAGGLRVSPSCV